MTDRDSPYRDPMRLSERRVRYEYRLALDFLVPHLDRWGIQVRGRRVLDLGCGNGGLSVALAERGAHCVGIDLNPERIAMARTLAEESGVTVEFVVGDILEMDDAGAPFDLVILSEVIEHTVTLSNAQALLVRCPALLAPGGRIYVSFPPWFSPFAGHQAGWHGLRRLPWVHLLPDRMKRRLAPEHAPHYIGFIQELNRITIATFERMVSHARMQIVRRELYHLRPEYHYRYGTPVIRSRLLATTPVIREITTSGAYYLLAPSARPLTPDHRTAPRPGTSSAT